MKRKDRWQEKQFLITKTKAKGHNDDFLSKLNSQLLFENEGCHKLLSLQRISALKRCKGKIMSSTFCELCTSVIIIVIIYVLLHSKNFRICGLKKTTCCGAKYTVVA